MTDTTEALALAKRVRAGWGEMVRQDAAAMIDAQATEIDALRAEVARLRAALTPFASAPVEYLAGGIYEVTVNGRDLIAARAAIDAARTGAEG